MLRLDITAFVFALKLSRREISMKTVDEQSTPDLFQAIIVSSFIEKILAFYEIAGKKIQQALTDSTSLMLTGKSESAIQQLDDAISVHPENIKLRIKRATLLWKQVHSKIMSDLSANLSISITTPLPQTCFIS